MPASLSTQSFLDGRPAGLTNVVRDASGRLVAWVENGFACQVARNAAGLPVTLTSAASTERLRQAFTYDSAGRLVGMTGDAIPTVFASELADPQPGVQALVTGAWNNEVLVTDTRYSDLSDITDLVNASAKLQAAIETITELGYCARVPSIGFPWRMTSTCTIPAGAIVKFDADCEFYSTTSATFVLGGENIELRGKLKIAGSNVGTAYHVTLPVGSDHCRIDAIEIDTGSAGVDVQSAANEIGSIYVREMRGGGLRFIGSSAVDNRVGSIRGRNVCNFLVTLRGGAARNKVGLVDKWLDYSKCSAWQLASVTTLPAYIGLEAVGNAYDCPDNWFGAVFCHGSNDAGMSICGDRCEVGGGRARDCNLTGGSIIGRDCTITGFISTGCKNGFSFTPNSGGTSKRNRLIGCSAINNREKGFQNDDAGAYRTWASGATFGSGSSYCQYGLNIYVSVPAPVDSYASGNPTLDVSTFGTTAPVHTSGTVSDGVVLWCWMASDPVMLSASENIIIAPTAYGNPGGDFYGIGAGTARVVAAPEGSGLNPFVSYMPTNDPVGGSARGSSATDWQQSRAQGGQVASGQFSVVGGGSLNTAKSLNSVVAGGRANTADGAYSAVFGGQYADTRGGYGHWSHASTRFGSTSGSAQQRSIPLAGSTTDATTRAITSDGSATVTGVNTLQLPDNYATAVTGMVRARDSSGNCAMWSLSFLFKRGAGAGTATIVGSPTVSKLYADTGASTWTVAVSNNTSIGGAQINVTGANGVTINWVGRLVCEEGA